MGGFYHPGFSFKRFATAKWIFSTSASCSGAVVGSCTRISRNKRRRLTATDTSGASVPHALAIWRFRQRSPIFGGRAAFPFSSGTCCLARGGFLGPGVEVLAKHGSFSLCPGCGAAPWLLLRFPGWWQHRAQPGAPKTHLSTASLTSVSSRETRLSRSLVLERNF